MIRVAVIGYGYWGPNIVRNFHGLADCTLVAVCDQNPKATRRVSTLYPGVTVTGDAYDILTATNVDAVAIVTPVSTHYGLARLALENGKHVFVEKPFTATVAQAAELMELAEKNHLQIMVDHTFLFTGAVRKMKELIDQDVLGPLYYYDSRRINLGLFQHDVNVLWDLAPHDLAIMDYLIAERPTGVIATGASHLNGLEDLAYITVYFSNDLIAHISVNWLSPVKIRTTLIGGNRKMLVWNDLEPDEKIKIYDKGVRVTSAEGVYNLLINYRSGDMWAPKLEPTEALNLETAYFIDCLLHNTKPFNDGASGLRVVQLLEAAQLSLKKRGTLVNLSPLS